MRWHGGRAEESTRHQFLCRSKAVQGVRAVNVTKKVHGVSFYVDQRRRKPSGRPTRRAMPADKSITGAAIRQRAGRGGQCPQISRLWAQLYVSPSDAPKKARIPAAHHPPHPTKANEKDHGGRSSCRRDPFLIVCPRACGIQPRSCAMKLSLFCRAVVVGRPRSGRDPIAHLTSINVSTLLCLASRSALSSASGSSARTQTG